VAPHQHIVVHLETVPPLPFRQNLEEMLGYTSSPLSMGFSPSGKSTDCASSTTRSVIGRSAPFFAANWPAFRQSNPAANKRAN